VRIGHSFLGEVCRSAVNWSWWGQMEDDNVCFVGISIIPVLKDAGRC